MRIVVLATDLIIASRILAQASAAGHDAQLVGEPSAMPPVVSVDLLFVNWADRLPSWADDLRSWRGDAPPSRVRVVLFGPHADLEAHADARAAGLGPMLARSKLVATLHALMGG